MKNGILFSVLICSLTVIAQDPDEEKLIIEKGTWNVGGNLSVTFSDNENAFNQQENLNNSKNFNITIVPNIGYAIGKNLMLGANVGVGFGTGDSSSRTGGFPDNQFSAESESTSWNIAPYVRAFLPVGKRTAFYVQGEVGYSTSKNSSSSEQNGFINTNESRNTGYSAGLRPGLTYFMTNRLALETQLGFLGYSTNTFESKDENDTVSGTSENSNFGFNFNPSQIFFGLSYYF